MPKKLYHVHLTAAQQQELQTLVSTGSHAARTIKRANILLLADQGKPDHEISTLLGCHPTTVERIRKCFLADGLPMALQEKPRPGQPVKLDGKAEAYLIALACSDPPEGRKTWTMDLLAGHLVDRHLVDSIAAETVRLRLKKTR